VKKLLSYSKVFLFLERRNAASNKRKGSVIECMIGVKISKKAEEQGSFVSCEARQSGILSLLPVSKGSAKWDKRDRDAELQM
jgi:hypothetical protein